MLRKFIWFGVIQILIMLAGIGVWVFAPNSDRFHQNYLNGIFDHFSRLENKSGYQNLRIVLLGGSSLGLSVSAEQLTRNLDLPVFNLGVQAGIGYKNIWDLNKSHLNPGKDIIIVSPEYESLVDEKPYHVEFCKVLFLQKKVSPLFKNPLCVFEILRQTGADLIFLAFSLKHPRDIYFRGAFNEYGDVVSHYQLESRAFPTGNAYRIKSHGDSRNYIKFIKEEIISGGFKVIYIPTVIPQSSCKGKEEDILVFQSFIMNAFGQTGFPEIEDLCFPDRLFFDTNYHMTVEGIEKRTADVYKLLKRELGPLLFSAN